MFQRSGKTGGYTVLRRLFEKICSQAVIIMYDYLFYIFVPIYSFVRRRNVLLEF